MKNIILLFGLCMIYTTMSAQVEIYIHQPKCNKKQIYIPNIETKRVQKDSATIVFTLDTPKYPQQITLIIDSIGYQHENFWIEPSTKKVDCMLYTCKHYRFEVEQPNQLTRDDRANSHYTEYLQEKYTDENLYIEKDREFTLAYIKENPQSYLSLYYLSSIEVNNASKLALLKTLQPYHAQDQLFKKIERSIKYKKLPKVGEIVNSITANTLLGKPFDISQLNKKPTVVMFWMSGCKWSTKLMPDINELNKKYKREGVNFVYYCLDENKAQWETTSIEKQIPPTNNISELDGYLGITPLSLGVNATPFFIVLDKDNRITMITYGNELPLVKKEISQLLTKK